LEGEVLFEIQEFNRPDRQRIAPGGTVFVVWPPEQTRIIPL
jgi:hypothetical protein